MSMPSIENLITLFEKWSGEKVASFSALPNSGSSRKYFRMKSESKSAIGALNNDERENKAFLYLSKHFLKNGLHVPRIYSSELKNGIYLQEDLGNITLFSLIESSRNQNPFSDEVIDLYKAVLEELIHFQIAGTKKLDYSKCYPRAKFDRQSMMWDLNYFKYYFLKLAHIPFDEQRLEDDFISLTNFLMHADCKYFMYRDFNSRNIMIKENRPYFIDYQGGRKGALQYDIASLLLDSKADLTIDLRHELLIHYLYSLKKILPIKEREFLKYYSGYSLIRLLQVFGAYGYRGYFEGKAHFLTSIPYAIKNLNWLKEESFGKNKELIKMKELTNVLNLISESDELRKFEWRNLNKEKLTVRVNSFSYRKSIPLDLSGNGGGFVFDCRAIPNPGRIEVYKQFTGRDKCVQDFLDSQPEAQKFLKESFDLVEQSVKNYIDSGWTDLMVSYGCTGGQHRSVYSAERLAQHISAKYNVNVQLTHTNLPVK